MDSVILTIEKISLGDWVLIATLLAIVVYTIETRRLRKLQRLQILLQVFFSQTKEWDSVMKARAGYPKKLQEIIATEYYDPSWAYSKNHKLEKSNYLLKIKNLLKF